LLRDRDGVAFGAVGRVAFTELSLYRGTEVVGSFEMSID